MLDSSHHSRGDSVATSNISNTLGIRAKSSPPATGISKTLAQVHNASGSAAASQERQFTLVTLGRTGGIMHRPTGPVYKSMQDGLTFVSDDPVEIAGTVFSFQRIAPATVSTEQGEVRFALDQGKIVRVPEPRQAGQRSKKGEGKLRPVTAEDAAKFGVPSAVEYKPVATGSITFPFNFELDLPVARELAALACTRAVPVQIDGVAKGLDECREMHAVLVPNEHGSPIFVAEVDAGVYYAADILPRDGRVTHFVKLDPKKEGDAVTIKQYLETTGNVFSAMRTRGASLDGTLGLLANQVAARKESRNADTDQGMSSWPAAPGISPELGAAAGILFAAPDQKRYVQQERDSVDEWRQYNYSSPENRNDILKDHRAIFEDEVDGVNTRNLANPNILSRIHESIKYAGFAFCRVQDKNGRNLVYFSLSAGARLDKHLLPIHKKMGVNDNLTIGDTTYIDAKRRWERIKASKANEVGGKAPRPVPPIKENDTNFVNLTDPASPQNLLPKQHSRDGDAERIIASVMLEEFEPPEAPLFDIAFYSLMDACKSCTLVMGELKEKYPSAYVAYCYGKEYQKAAAESRLKSEVKSQLCSPNPAEVLEGLSRLAQLVENNPDLLFDILLDKATLTSFAKLTDQASPVKRYRYGDEVAEPILFAAGLTRLALQQKKLSPQAAIALWFVPGKQQASPASLLARNRSLLAVFPAAKAVFAHLVAELLTYADSDPDIGRRICDAFNSTWKGEKHTLAQQLDAAPVLGISQLHRKIKNKMSQAGLSLEKTGWLRTITARTNVRRTLAPAFSLPIRENFDASRDAAVERAQRIEKARNADVTVDVGAIHHRLDQAEKEIKARLQQESQEAIANVQASNTECYNKQQQGYADHRAALESAARNRRKAAKEAWQERRNEPGSLSQALNAVSQEVESVRKHKRNQMEEGRQSAIRNASTTGSSLEGARNPSAKRLTSHSGPSTGQSHNALVRRSAANEVAFPQGTTHDPATGEFELPAQASIGGKTVVGSISGQITGPAFICEAPNASTAAGGSTDRRAANREIPTVVGYKSACDAISVAFQRGGREVGLAVAWKDLVGRKIHFNDQDGNPVITASQPRASIFSFHR